MDFCYRLDVSFTASGNLRVNNIDHFIVVNSGVTATAFFVSGMNIIFGNRNMLTGW